MPLDSLSLVIEQYKEIVKIERELKYRGGITMKSKAVEQIYKIDSYYNRKESIPCADAIKAIELVSDISIRNERGFISQITNLTIKDTTCYEVLQSSYRTIRQEKEALLTNLTDENLAIFLTQYKIAHSYHQFINSMSEEILDSQLINEMNRRVVDSIGNSAKVFRKIDHMSR